MKSFETYKQDVILDYKAKKEKGFLPFNLQNPTPANLKKECISIFPTTHSKAHNHTFPALFGDKDSAADYLTAFENSDPDIFRPLNKFLREDTKVGTNNRNIYLLAWLIGFESDVLIPVPEPDYTLPTPFYLQRLLPIFIDLLIAVSIVYFIYLNSNKKCMYWDNDHYQTIACEQREDGTIIIDLDPFRLEHQKRILNPSLLSARDIGKVYYSKTNGVVDFYAMGGENPTDTNKRLLPMSLHIYKKYVLKSEN